MQNHYAKCATTGIHVVIERQMVNGLIESTTTEFSPDISMKRVDFGPWEMSSKSDIAKFEKEFKPAFNRLDSLQSDLQSTKINPLEQTARMVLAI